MPQIFSSDDFYRLCDNLAVKDSDLAAILESYGYPPMWSRPNTFETLVYIILEQQVSLASAKAALEKLRAKVGIITPHTVMSLTDEEFKACYFSRQKMSYTRNLAQEIMRYKLSLNKLTNVLKRLKHLPKDCSRDDVLRITASWSPYRTIGTMLLWHYYLSRRSLF